MAKHFAILIGIDAYPEEAGRGPLRGCVNDVLHIKDLLHRQQSPPVETWDLIAAAGPQVEDRNPQPSESLPTYDNVLNAIAQTKNKAQKGDCVYIHYSGHGTHYPTAPGPSEHETKELNEVLALCLLDDEDPNAVLPLEGRDFAKSINGLVAKGIAVTVVLDCCFSARVYRNDYKPGLRCLPANHPSISLRNGQIQGSELLQQGSESCQEVSDLRDILMLNSWLIDPQGYTMLVACGPLEKASEVKVAGQIFGQLSYFLLEALRSHGFYHKQKDIYNYVAAGFRGVTSLQTPVLYGNKEQPFLGQPVANCRSLIYGADVGIPVERSQDGKTLVLRAGEAHGLCAGDHVHIQGHLKMTAIKEAGALKSVLETDDTVSVSQDTFLLAQPTTRLRCREFPIFLDASVGHHLMTLRKSLEEIFLTVYKHPSKKFVFQVMVEADSQGQGEQYVILDAQGCRLVNLPHMDTSTSIDHITKVIAHVTSYHLVKELKNNNLDYQGFHDSFDTWIATRSGGRYAPGQVIELQEPAPQDGKATFEVNFVNKGVLPLYVYIYALSSLWEVEHVHFATFDMVPSAEAAEKASRENQEVFHPRLRKKLRISVPPAMRGTYTHCDDIVKVFVTTEPTVFDILELASLDNMPNGGKEYEVRSQKRGNPVVELWDAFNFTIRTRFRD